MNPAAADANKLLERAIQSRASDIHFHPSNKLDQVIIYFRINGKRRKHRKITLHKYRLLLTYFKFTSGMDIGEVRRPQHGTIHETYKEADYSFRLATLPVRELESLSIRILPQEQYLHPERLFLFHHQFIQMKKWIRKKAGLILATGPTGCGKSTLIYTLLEKRMKESSSQIVTIEEPIERHIDHLLQVEVNEKAGINYYTGLTAALRHDPDIIMIGEIRDEKTAKIAIRAALTGHLVISTVHAKNAIKTIERLVDLGISRKNLSQTLIAIIALRLISIQRKLMDERTAIAEILDGENLNQIIKGKEEDVNLKTFKDLKRKAYAYGFLSHEQI